MDMALLTQEEKMGGSGSGRKFEPLTTAENVRFDLRKTVEHNFNLYQDALSAFPTKQHAIKLRFDQYLKAVRLHKEDQQTQDEESIIEFKQAE